MDQTEDITIGGTVAQGQWPVEKDWATKSQLQKGSFATQQRDSFVHSKVRIWLLRKIQKEKPQPAGGEVIYNSTGNSLALQYHLATCLKWLPQVDSFWTCSRFSMILHSLGQTSQKTVPGRGFYADGLKEKIVSSAEEVCQWYHGDGRAWKKIGISGTQKVIQY